MKNLIFLFTTLLLMNLAVSAQDAYVSIDSLELLEQVIAKEEVKANERPTRVVGTSKTVYAGKVVQAYDAQNMITEDLLALFKDINQEVKVINDKNNNRLILSGAPDEIDFALEQLNVLDEEQTMVTIEFMLIEYFHDDEFDWGFDILNGTTGNVGRANYTPAGNDGLLDFEFKSVAKLVPEFHFNLQALVNDDKAKIVTNPHVAVEAGSEAVLNIKDERTIRLETATINGVTINLKPISAGIDLRVTPVMINDNLIKLDLYGYVSEFLPFSSSGEFLKEENKVTTVVDVRPGETLIIGGMIKEEHNTLTGGVPYLKDIPLLGYLFKRKRRIKTYIERVMYVTPYINSGHTVEDYQKIRGKTQLEKDISEMIETNKEFIRYDNTRKAYKKRGFFKRLFNR